MVSTDIIKRYFYWSHECATSRCVKPKLQYGLYLVSWDLLYFSRPNKHHIYVTPLWSSYFVWLHYKKWFYTFMQIQLMLWRIVLLSSVVIKRVHCSYFNNIAFVDIWAISYEIMVLFVHRKLILQTCMHSHHSAISGARCLIFGRTLRLLPYLKCANSEGYGETVQMRRLARAIADRLCDKFHNLMSWLIFSF